MLILIWRVRIVIVIKMMTTRRKLDLKHQICSFGRSNEGVNRIHAMTQDPHICASWGDTGQVQVWDSSSHPNALAESENDVNRGASIVSNHAPLAYLCTRMKAMQQTGLLESSCSRKACIWIVLTLLFLGVARTLIIYGNHHLILLGILILNHLLDIQPVSKIYNGALQTFGFHLLLSG